MEATGSRGRRALLALLLGLPLLACDGAPTEPGAGSTPAAPAEAPTDAAGVERVVLVSIDTLRADRVGAYGHEGAETPTLDRLAASGVRFDAAISPAPITLPAHATLLTGLDPPRHGVRHNGLFRLRDGIATLAGRLRDAGFQTGAFVSAYVLDRRFGLDRGFQHYDGEIGASSPGHAGPAVPERSADRTVDAALDWLAATSDRFFAFVHLYDPHADHTPPEPYRTRFGEARLYDAEIAFADAEVGRLLDFVARRWPSGALVVVTSDHGESLGEHGEPTHSLTVYDATQRVPLIVTGPGVPSGEVVPDVVRLADVAPTVLDLVGLPAIGGDGESLRPLWEDADAPPRVAWVETLATQLDFGWSPLLGIRTTTHKYIRAPRPELFDLRTDPGELENVAASEPERVRRLDAMVEERAGGLPVEPDTDLDPQERAQLEALGYVTERAPQSREKLGIVGGPDPKDEMHLLGPLFEAMSLLARRRFDEALVRFDRVGNRSLELSLLRGQAALGAGELEAAREAAEAAIRFAPGRGQPHVLKGQVEEAAGRPDAAQRAYRRALEVEPSQGAAWIGLGRLAEADGRIGEALEAYRRATEARIFEAEAVWRQAALRMERGELAEARRLLTRLPQAELRQPPAAARLARAELASGAGEMARIRVSGALRAFPDDLPLLLLRGTLLELDGRPGEALRVRRDALAAHPEDPRARQAVARHLARHGGSLEEAQTLARASLSVLGRKPGILDTLALVHLARGRPAEALAVVEEALGMPTEPTERARASLLLRRAEALAALGREEASRAALAAAAESAKGQPELEWDLRRTRARIERLLPGGAEAPARPPSPSTPQG